MSYRRVWRDPRNAVGFAAACARLALHFYPITDIAHAVELAERYAAGEDVPTDELWTADAAARDAAEAARDAYAAYAAEAAAYAAEAARDTYAAEAARDTYAAEAAAYAAEAAGVPLTEIQHMHATWIVRDLTDEPLNPEIEAACFAAVLAGHEAVAKSLIR